MKLSHSIVTGCLVVMGGVEHTAHAQIDGGNGPQPGDLQISLNGGYEHAFDTDIDDGGEFNVSSANFNLSLRSIQSSDFHITLAFDYSYDDYDFDGTTGIGGLDPWDDIHTQRISLIFTKELSNDWSIFGGPVAVFARESGASFDDSDVYGGLIGFSYRQSESLVFGLGAGILDKLEDNSTRFFPVIILNWQLRPDLRLATNTNSGSTQLELVYSYDDTLDLAAGLSVRYDRFRLDDDGPIIDGIGEVTSIPLTARATYKLDANSSISVLAGVRMGGEIRLEDDNGNKLSEEDFDGAFFAGVSLSLNF